MTRTALCTLLALAAPGCDPESQSSGQPDCRFALLQCAEGFACRTVGEDTWDCVADSDASRPAPADAGTEAGAEACLPGRVVACACDDDRRGTRTCADDGTFRPCVCFDPSEALCGDGAIAAGEECDDGNLDNGDGCGAGCLLEVSVRRHAEPDLRSDPEENVLGRQGRGGILVALDPAGDEDWLRFHVDGLADAVIDVTPALGEECHPALVVELLATGSSEPLAVALADEGCPRLVPRAAEGTRDLAEGDYLIRVSTSTDVPAPHHVVHVTLTLPLLEGQACAQSDRRCAAQLGCYGSDPGACLPVGCSNGWLDPGEQCDGEAWCDDACAVRFTPMEHGDLLQGRVLRREVHWYGFEAPSGALLTLTARDQGDGCQAEADVTLQRVTDEGLAPAGLAPLDDTCRLGAEVPAGAYRLRVAPAGHIGRADYDLRVDLRRGAGPGAPCARIDPVSCLSPLACVPGEVRGEGTCQALFPEPIQEPELVDLVDLGLVTFDAPITIAGQVHAEAGDPWDLFLVRVPEATTVAFETSDGRGGCPGDSALVPLRAWNIERRGLEAAIETGGGARDDGGVWPCARYTESNAGTMHLLVTPGPAAQGPVPYVLSAHAMPVRERGDSCDVHEQLDQCLGFPCGLDAETGDGICAPPACGDGWREQAFVEEAGRGFGDLHDRMVRPSFEECDDGNNRGGDGCTPDCRIETDLPKAHEPVLIELVNGVAEALIPDRGGEVGFELDRAVAVEVIVEPLVGWTCAETRIVAGPWFDPDRWDVTRATCALDARYDGPLPTLEPGAYAVSVQPPSGPAEWSRLTVRELAPLAVGDRCDGTPRACGPDGHCLPEGEVERCIRNQCGDGLLAEEEVCDDGNDVPGDGCDPQCRPDDPAAREPDSLESPNALALDAQGVATMRFEISEPGDSDWFSFEWPGGADLRVQVEPIPGAAPPFNRTAVRLYEAGVPELLAPPGRFGGRLLTPGEHEAVRDLPAGAYVVRVDALDDRAERIGGTALLQRLVVRRAARLQPGEPCFRGGGARCVEGAYCGLPGEGRPRQCVPAECGDGLRQLNEECDPGDEVDPTCDGCRFARVAAGDGERLPGGGEAPNRFEIALERATWLRVDAAFEDQGRCGALPTIRVEKPGYNDAPERLPSPTLDPGGLDGCGTSVGRWLAPGTYDVAVDVRLNAPARPFQVAFDTGPHPEPGLLCEGSEQSACGGRQFCLESSQLVVERDRTQRLRACGFLGIRRDREAVHEAEPNEGRQSASPLPSASSLLGRLEPEGAGGDTFDLLLLELRGQQDEVIRFRVDHLSGRGIPMGWRVDVDLLAAEGVEAAKAAALGRTQGGAMVERLPPGSHYYLVEELLQDQAVEYHAAIQIGRSLGVSCDSYRFQSLCGEGTCRRRHGESSGTCAR